MRLFLIAGLALAVAVPAAAEENRRTYQRANKLVLEAHRDAKADRLDVASEKYEEALRLVPYLPDAHAGLGAIAMRQKNYEGALRQFENARKGYDLLSDRLFSAEQKRFTKARDTNRVLGDLLIQINAAHLKISQAQRAMMTAQIRNAMHDNEMVEAPDNTVGLKVPPFLLFMIGNAQFHLARLDEARENWEACAKGAPKFGPVFNNLAVIYWKLGRTTEALANVARAEELGVDVNPDFKKRLAQAGKSAGGKGRS